jgi:NitT/TauT family transport system permease protein
MAGELLVIIAHRPSLGVQLETDQQMNDTTDMIAIMIVVLIIGILMDRLFTWADRSVRRRWGLDLTSA